MYCACSTDYSYIEPIHLTIMIIVQRVLLHLSSLLLKHHQWNALSREHAARIAEGPALRAGVALFEEWFLGEPLCSDEV